MSTRFAWGGGGGGGLMKRFRDDAGTKNATMRKIGGHTSDLPVCCGGRPCSLGTKCNAGR